MKNLSLYTEKEHKLEIIKKVDVLVVGGGPAGIAAAVGAAKTGVSVMLIEAMGSFGGMWTNGLVITLAGFNSWLRPYRRCVNGVMGEWLDMAEQKNGAENNRSWVLNSDPEIMKLTADELLVKHGVHCLLHTWMSDVIMEDSTLKGVVIENVDGRKAIFAKNIVDCTGNGDVIARSNTKYFISSELQPMTLSFFLANVKPIGNIAFESELTIPFGPEPGFLGKELLNEYTSRRRDIYIDRDKLNRAYHEGNLPSFGGPWFGGMRENYPWVNTTRLYGSAVNANELTFSEIQARKNAHQIVEYYRSNCKGFEQCWIMNTSATIGVRETRRLAGQYIMTKDDILGKNIIEDSIALGVWPIDVHPPKGNNGMHDMFVPLPYKISYRSLLPIKTKNLIVGGRCISADRDALGSLRVGATCGAIGHAAGVSAGLSVLKNCQLDSLSYIEIKKELLNQHAIIE